MAADEHMRRAIALAEEAMRANTGGPFGAVVVKDGAIIGEGANHVTSTNDPTAHAEIVAIRAACEALARFTLDGCDIYTSCEPCPMCLAAIYWARIPRVYFANSRKDAARIGFDDDHIYHEIAMTPARRSVPMTRMLADEAATAFEEWVRKGDRIPY